MDLHRAWTEARAGVARRFYEGTGRLFRAESDGSRAACPLPDPRTFEEPVLAAVRRGEAAEAEAVLCGFFDELRVGRPPAEVAKRLARELVERLAGSLDPEAAGDGPFAGAEPFADACRRASTLQRVQDAALDRFRRMLSHCPLIPPPGISKP
jgi:hypothetical protein